MSRKTPVKMARRSVNYCLCTRSSEIVEVLCYLNTLDAGKKPVLEKEADPAKTVDFGASRYRKKSPVRQVGLLKLQTSNKAAK